MPTINLNFYDNKVALDNLLTKPDGLFHIIDDASRISQDQDLIMGMLKNFYYLIAADILMILILRRSSCRETQSIY